MGAGRTAGRGYLCTLPAQGDSSLGSQTPLMPRSMDAPLPGPGLWKFLCSEWGQFLAQGSGSCSCPRVGGSTPSSSVLGCREYP